VTRPGSIPVTIVTGFLGAGKTSLLNALLRAPEMSASLVLINEWGDVGLDHLLIEKVDGDMIAMMSGCLCCTLRGDLVDTLRDRLEQRDRAPIGGFERIVIETTGLADPSPVIQAILGDGATAARLHIAGIVTLIDAVNCAATMIRHRVGAAQIAVADVLAISKSDLIDPAARAEALRALAFDLRARNRAARIVDLGANGFAVKDFLALERRFDSPEMSEAPAPPIHNAWIRTRVLRSARPIDEAAFSALLDLLRGALGSGLLRIKGLVALAGSPDTPLVLQGARDAIQTSRRLPRWPDGDATTRIVVIFEGASGATIDRLWAAATRAPTIDAPDMAALTHSPLSAPRGGLLN